MKDCLHSRDSGVFHDMISWSFHSSEVEPILPWVSRWGNCTTCQVISHLALAQLKFVIWQASTHVRAILSFAVKAGPPLEAILVIFGRRALIFFVRKLLEKNEKWHHFCAHAQWWSPWRRKNVENGHLAPSNLTFLLIAIDTNGFRRMKEEG